MMECNGMGIDRLGWGWDMVEKDGMKWDKTGGTVMGWDGLECER